MTGLINTLAVAGPLTLAQLLGVPLEPARLDESALVVIDAQGEYRDGPLRVDQVDAAVEHLAGLLKRARAGGTPVIHVVQLGQPGGPFDPTGPRGAIIAEANPVAGEPVIAKPAPDAFVGTDLAETVASTGRKKLILVGFQTHLCVEATARDAVARGYGVTVVSDAVATRALPDPLGGSPIPADTLQRASLAALSDAFAVVTTSSAIK
jgi:nicotinamidase-related amidase